VNGGRFFLVRGQETGTSEGENVFGVYPRNGGMEVISSTEGFEVVVDSYVGQIIGAVLELRNTTDALSMSGTSFAGIVPMGTSILTNEEELISRALPDSFVKESRGDVFASSGMSKVTDNFSVASGITNISHTPLVHEPFLLDSVSFVDHDIIDEEASFSGTNMNELLTLGSCRLKSVRARGYMGCSNTCTKTITFTLCKDSVNNVIATRLYSDLEYYSAAFGITHVFDVDATEAAEYFVNVKFFTSGDTQTISHKASAIVVTTNSITPTSTGNVVTASNSNQVFGNYAVPVVGLDDNATYSLDYGVLMYVADDDTRSASRVVDSPKRTKPLTGIL
jgi:hypothetical protein